MKTESDISDHKMNLLFSMKYADPCMAMMSMCISQLTATAISMSCDTRMSKLNRNRLCIGFFVRFVVILYGYPVATSSSH